MKTLVAPNTQKLQKLAELARLGLSVGEIGRVINCTDETVRTFMDTEEYKTICANVALAHAQRDKELEKGWESVERRGVKNVLDYMRQATDPDFALRAAAVAQRARIAPAQNGFMKHPDNRPIAVDAGNNIVVLTIHNNFVQAIHKGIDIKNNGNGIKDKQENVLPPGRLNAVLEDKREKPKAISLYDELEQLWQSA